MLKRSLMWVCPVGVALFSGLVVASNWYHLRACVTVGVRRWEIGVDRGVIYCYLAINWPLRPGTPRWGVLAAPAPYDGGYSFWGWAWHQIPSGAGMFRQVAFPAWVTVPPLAVGGFVLWRAVSRERRRLLAGKCLVCGYDRRGLANPSAPCPECGASPKG